MRVAFVGKGGAGKSSIAGVFARLLARDGTPVLALDSDPMPGLAYSLGVPNRDAGIPSEAVEEFEEEGRKRYRLRTGLDATTAVERYATVSPDGVLFVQLGKARGVKGENWRSHQAYQLIVDGLPADEWSVVGDLPGGTRQPFFGWGRYAKIVLVVTEPTPASLLSARRLARLALHPAAPSVLAVANKTRSDSDVDLVARRTGLRVVGNVPYDEAQGRADRSGMALLDLDPATAMVSAVASLVSSLSAEEIAVT